MEKPTKTFGIIMLLLLILICAGFIYIHKNPVNKHHSMAENPDMEEITGFKYTDIIINEQVNNRETAFSGWEWRKSTFTFKESLNEQITSDLDLMCASNSKYWSLVKNSSKDIKYQYSDDAWNNGGVYSVTCTFDKDGGEISYFVKMHNDLPLKITLYVMLFIWVIVMIMRFITYIRPIFMQAVKTLESNVNEEPDDDFDDDEDYPNDEESDRNQSSKWY